jgi:hypothetical protein
MKMFDSWFDYLMLAGFLWVQRGIKSLLAKNKDYSIDIWCFSSKHAPLRSKNKDGMERV